MEARTEAEARGPGNRQGASCTASGGISAGSSGGEAVLESGSLKLIICLEKGGGEGGPPWELTWNLCLAFSWRVGGAGRN